MQKQLGWTHAALVAGARDVGVSPAIAGALDKGGADLVEVTLPLQCNLHSRETIVDASFHHTHANPGRRSGTIGV